MDHGYFTYYSTPQHYDPAGLYVYPRVVIVGGLATSSPRTYTVGDSAWGLNHVYHSVDVQQHWEDVMSLGPGLYSATFEIRGVSTDTGSSRIIGMGPNNTTTLNVIEGLTPVA